MEVKEELRNEKARIEERMKQLMLEKSESEATVQVLREQYESLKVAKE
jgi:chromosome segregation ATPase